MTAAVAAMSDANRAKVLAAVQHFGNFNADNDPHGEHDFGIFELDGISLNWKID
jgi:hypothetical protein